MYAAISNAASAGTAVWPDNGAAAAAVEAA